MNLSQTNLHVPDGFLSLTISIVFWIVTAIIVSLAVKHSQETLKQRQIPLMGIMAAFLFAAQMINFPVAGGTSGHLLGGALAAIILGPWPGMLVMTSVIGLQALLFQDGGLIVMGANIFNMGLITSAIGYGLYAIFQNKSRKIQLGTIAVASWLSVIASALFTSLQLWLSGVSPARIVFPAMLSVHTLIGIGEALISVAAFSFILQVRPDLIKQTIPAKSNNLGWAAIGILITIAVVLLSPFASANPDGLERVADDLGFIELAQNSPLTIFSDYLVPSIANAGLSTILAGVIGVMIIGVITYLFAKKLSRKPTT
jgi:cobalt/nickel transport system permease protein